MASRICMPNAIQVAALEAAEAGPVARPAPSDLPDAGAALAGAKAALQARLTELQQVLARPEAHGCALLGVRDHGGGALWASARIGSRPVG